ncbi:hypothetical protein ES703_82531 [subsurface metagenome]
MRVILAQNITNDTGAFLFGPVVSHSQLRHAIEHPAMNRLKTVAHVRQRPADDHRHGVVEIRLGYLFYDFARFGFSPCYVHKDLSFN